MAARGAQFSGPLSVGSDVNESYSEWQKLSWQANLSLFYASGPRALKVESSTHFEVHSA